mmetsp:Transcript_2170/g.4710  ORF Transcript_2170/g.4710 Transcript_2170/m.4710 type:complete len:226 (-) Transcript_2170:578-1255(-)
MAKIPALAPVVLSLVLPMVVTTMAAMVHPCGSFVPASSHRRGLYYYRCHGMPGTTQQQQETTVPGSRGNSGGQFAAACFSSCSSPSRSSSSSLSMRDRSSSYWFSVGDTVRVVEDVFCGGGGSSNKNGNTNAKKKKKNLKGRTGTVVETWEKCDVDPTCCCAEQVDTNMAVRVAFAGTDADGAAALGRGTTGAGAIRAEETRDEREPAPLSYYYFAEEELVRVAD